MFFSSTDRLSLPKAKPETRQLSQQTYFPFCQLYEISFYILVVANKSIHACEPSFETLTKIIVQLIPCYQDQNLLLLLPPGFCCFLTEHQPRSLRSDDSKKITKTTEWQNVK